MLNIKSNLFYIMILFIVFFSSVFVLRLLLQIAFSIYLFLISNDTFSLDLDDILSSLKLSFLAGYLGAGGIFTAHRLGKIYLLLFLSVSFFLIWII